MNRENQPRPLGLQVRRLRWFWNYRTPAAPLYALTEHKGPYRWFGITIGEWFIGVMRSNYDA